MSKFLVIVNSRVLNLRVILEQITHFFFPTQFLHYYSTFATTVYHEKSIKNCSFVLSIFLSKNCEEIESINENDYFAPKTL